MPQLKQYGLFISHVWRSAENAEYYRLVNLLNEANYFGWSNYSVPQHDPLGTKNDRELVQALDNRIKLVHCVLIISGMYTNYRKWIQAEIDIALKYRKPIIGIRPLGQSRIPQQVQSVSKEMVGWRTDAIVEAVRKYSL